MPSDPVKAFRFYFTFKSLLELRHAKRGAHRRVKGERERERTTYRRSGMVEREREKEERVGRVSRV